MSKRIFVIRYWRTMLLKIWRYVVFLLLKFYLLKKKGLQIMFCNPLILMVSPVGIEPTTY